MKFGIDVGNGYVKYNGGRFASKIKSHRLEEPYGELHSVVYNGIEYTVGSIDGVPVADEDKYYTENYLILLLTGICLSCKDRSTTINAETVIGVPANQYNKETRNAIKQHLLESPEQKISVDGRDYLVNLKAIEVFMEGSAVIHTNDTGKVLVIDVGAGTVNVVKWEDKKKANDYTFEESFISLYNDMSNILNRSPYKLGKTAEQMDEYVGAEHIKISGDLIPSPELPKMLDDFINKCATNIQRQKGFEYKACDKIILIGGGAGKTVDYWKKYFPNIKMIEGEDSQFINQEVYQAVAEVVF